MPNAVNGRRKPKKSFSVRQVRLRTSFKPLSISPKCGCSTTAGFHFSPEDAVEFGLTCAVVGMAAKSRVKITGKPQQNSVSIICDNMTDKYLERLSKKEPGVAALLGFVSRNGKPK